MLRLRLVPQSFPSTMPSLTQSKQKQNWSNADANVSACASAESREAARAWACAKRSALPACQCRFRWWSAYNCPLIPIPFPTLPTQSQSVSYFFFFCFVLHILNSFCSFFGFVLIEVLLIVLVAVGLWLRFCLGRFVLVRYLCWQCRRHRQRDNGDYLNTCYMHVRYQRERERKREEGREQESRSAGETELAFISELGTAYR